MHTNILRIGFSRLKKLEVQFLASSVIGIVEKHDPETLHIKEIFDILVEHEPQIKLLKIGYGPHPITSDLGTLRKRRNAYAQGMIDRINTIERTKEGGMESALKVAKPIVFRYLQSLSRNSEKIIRQTLIQFFDLFGESASLQTAMTTLGLQSHIDGLQSVVCEIDEQYELRRESISARPKAKTPDIVAVVRTVIQDLFKQIEVAQIKHQELDYTSLIDELNLEIARAKAEVKARASYNKNKAENALNDNEVVEDDEVVVESDPEEPSESTYTTERIYPMMSVEADDEDDLGQLDKKKTVAVSTKQTRLPNVSNEA